MLANCDFLFGLKSVAGEWLCTSSWTGPKFGESADIFVKEF